MSLVNGEVMVNDTPSKSKLFRFCEKKIDQWLRNHRPSVDASFKVEFTEEETKQVSCVTEVQIGDSRYRGFDLATDEQEAFMHSLKRLQLH